MKTRIMIYGVLVFFLSVSLYFIAAEKLIPSGSATGKVKKYSIINEMVFADILKANDKGFMTAYKDENTIKIWQINNKGKTVFIHNIGVPFEYTTYPHGIINKFAWINDIRLLTSPYGVSTCLVWTEVCYDNTQKYYPKALKIYYMYFETQYDLYSSESADYSKVKQIDEIKLNLSPKQADEAGKTKFLETSALSYLEIICNDYPNGYILYSILYISNETPKLVNIDSSGYDSPIKTLPFTISPKNVKLLWNKNDKIYTLINYEHINNYRMIQFDNDGDALQDKDFELDDVFKPKNMYFVYNEINDEYHIFVSQDDKLYFVIMDNLGNIIKIKQVELSPNFFGEFDILDQGKYYDIIYASKLSKNTMELVFDIISLNGSPYKKSIQLYSFWTYADTVQPLTALLNGVLGIRYKKIDTQGGSLYNRILLVTPYMIDLLKKSVNMDNKIPIEKLQKSLKKKADEI